MGWSLTFARRFNSSPAICGLLAAPAVPYVIAPGLERASAIRSFIEFTGSPGCAARSR
jgi:hypothetical protein